MNKKRLEAFSDGVIAIIITIMVLEMKVPQGGTFQALAALAPVFLTSVLSFAYLIWLVPDRRIERMLVSQGK